MLSVQRDARILNYFSPCTARIIYRSTSDELLLFLRVRVIEWVSFLGWRTCEFTYATRNWSDLLCQEFNFPARNHNTHMTGRTIKCLFTFSEYPSNMGWFGEKTFSLEKTGNNLINFPQDSTLHVWLTYLDAIRIDMNAGLCGFLLETQPYYQDCRTIVSTEHFYMANITLVLRARCRWTFGANFTSTF